MWTAPHPDPLPNGEREKKDLRRYRSSTLNSTARNKVPGARPVILIGQFDSPFVRRVGIALKLYDVAFEHRPWSTFGDGDKIVPFNPLRRVPTLVLDNGETLIESAAILDHLDERAGPA